MVYRVLFFCYSMISNPWTKFEVPSPQNQFQPSHPRHGFLKVNLGGLNFANVPTLRSVVYYSMGEDESIDGVFNFGQLFNAGGSAELNELKGIKVELV